MHAVLESLLTRLDAAEPYAAVVVGPPPSGSDSAWIRVAELANQAEALDAALGAATALCNGMPDAGAACLAGWVGELVAGKPFAAFESFERTWRLDPEAIWLRRHADGWYDGIAIADTPVRVAATDPAASRAGDVIVHTDRAAIAAALAADVVAVLTPIFAAIRRRARFGTRGMWGTTADSLTAGSAYAALRRGGDERDSLAEVAGFLDLLELAGAPPITRPETRTVVCRQRPAVAVRKGTCCLWYKTGTDEDGEPHYCLACPLREFAPTLPRWREWLESELDAASA